MKEKPFKADICRIYKSQAEDLLLFSWVTAMQKVAPGSQIRTCIVLFLDYYNLSEDDYPLDVAEVTYHRMKEKFFNCQKTDKD